MDQFTGPGANEPDGHKLIHIVGTETQLNDALKALVYTPDDDYHFTGSNFETLHMLLVPGASERAEPAWERRRDSLLSSMSMISLLHDGPAYNKSAQPGIELVNQR